MTKDVHFPTKEALIHFIAENNLQQFAVLKHHEEDYELAYIPELQDQPLLA